MIVPPSRLDGSIISSTSAFLLSDIILHVRSVYLFFTSPPWPPIYTQTQLAFLIDNKLYGRKWMQIIGFLMDFILFIIPAFKLNTSPAKSTLSVFKQCTSSPLSLTNSAQTPSPSSSQQKFTLPQSALPPTAY